MTTWRGRGGTPPQPPGYRPPGRPDVAAGNSAILRARLVLVSGTGGGIFVYTGTPKLGNPPIFWATSASADPFGNTIPSTAGIGGTGTFRSGNTIITPSGLFVYSGTPALGNLIVSIANAAGTDSFGNVYPQGLNVTKGTISGTTFAGLAFLINSAGAFFYSQATPPTATVVQSVRGSSANGNNLAVPITATGSGNTLAVTIMTTGTSGITVTSAKLGTTALTPIKSGNDSALGGTDFVFGYFLPSIASGQTTVTITVSAVVTELSAEVTELSGLTGTNVSANGIVTPGQSTSPSSGSQQVLAGGFAFGAIMDNGPAGSISGGTWTTHNTTHGVFANLTTANTGLTNVQLNGTFGSTSLWAAGVFTVGTGTLSASITSASGTDAYGNAYLAGITSYGGAAPPDFAVELNGGAVQFSTATSTEGPWTNLATLGGVVMGANSGAVEVSPAMYFIGQSTPATAISGGPVLWGDSNSNLEVLLPSTYTAPVSTGQCDRTATTVTQASATALTKAWPIPATDIHQNTKYRIRASGIGTWGSTAQNLTMGVGFGGTQKRSAAISSTIFAINTNFMWNAEYTMTGLTTGVSGTVWLSCTFTITQLGITYTLTTGQLTLAFGSNTTVNGETINTTANTDMELFASWGSTTGAPTITCVESSFERIAV